MKTTIDRASRNSPAVSACASLFLLLALATGSADEKGQDIVKKLDAAEKSSSSKMTFEMSIHPSGGGSARDFTVLSYENKSGDSLVEFLEPRAVRGLKILSKGSSSWVFFPSTGRVRKIGSSSRSGSVQGVGGDFSYDDLGSGTWDSEYDFTVIQETGDSWELEGMRKTAEAAYDSVRIAVSKETFLATRSSFALATEGGYYKELIFSDFRDYGGRKRAGKMEMKNGKKGSSTEIVLKEAQFDIPLGENLFDSSRFHQ